MKHLTQDDILSLSDFRTARPSHEREVLEHKSSRRLSLGPRMVLLFENHVTLRWQIHEMCRVEGIDSEQGVKHELETYNALLPASDSLSATLLIGYDDPEVRNEMLRKLLGLEKHISLEIAGCEPAPLRFDDAQYNDDRVSSVQFVRIPLTPTQRTAFCNLAVDAVMLCDHPAYPARAPLEAHIRAALVEDLTAD